MIKESFNAEIVSKKLEKILIQWKAYGAVSTPQEIVDLMVDLSEIQGMSSLEILEPACGFCNFLLNIYSKFPDKKHKFFGVELNKEIYQEAKKLFGNFPFELINADFLLWETSHKFDLIIGNPPYGIIGNKSHYPIYSLNHLKNTYKEQFATWFGKYNIYGAFIEKSISLLKETGKLVFIIPATWMILDDFNKLRRFLSLHGKTKVYYLGRGVFRGIGVSTCILVFEKSKNGAELYYRNGGGFVLSNILNKWNGSILRFENKFTRYLEESSVKLGELFDIKISARSTEVRNFGCLSYEKCGEEYVPLLNGRNIKKGFITRDNYTHLWLKRSEVPQLKAFYKILPRIVVGHTKGGKIFAAIEDDLYPYVGDVYHLLPKTRLTRMELEKILEWLNSKEIEEYIKTLYKEITPHVTKTQLKLVPLKYDEIKDARGHLL